MSHQGKEDMDRMEYVTWLGRPPILFNVAMGSVSKTLTGSSSPEYLQKEKERYTTGQQ